MIRLVRRADLGRVRDIFVSLFATEYARRGVDIGERVLRYQRWYYLLRCLSWFPNPLRYTLNIHVLERDGGICGFIQTAPGNRSRSRWHIDFVGVAPENHGQGLGRELVEFVTGFYGRRGVLRFTLEVDEQNDGAKRFYEKLGFHTYAINTYFRVEQQPVASGDEGLAFQTATPHHSDAIYQLYVASTPAVVRLIDEREPADFRVGLWEHLINTVRSSLKHRDDLRFVLVEEGQVVAFVRIIAQYRMLPHTVQVMVHPAYEGLYDGVLTYASRILAEYPSRPVLAWAADYQAAKLQALRNWGMGVVASDHCLVRQSTINAKSGFPDNRLAVEDTQFKPAYTNRV